MSSFSGGGLVFKTSPNQTLTAGATCTWAHGLGVAPKIIDPYAVCLTAEGNWSANDTFLINYETLNSNDGCVCWSDAINCYFRLASGGRIFMCNKTTGGDLVWTIANWAMQFRVGA